MDGGDGMKVAYTRIKKPRRVTDDPVIYVCSPYAADPERNARRAENFCRYVWKIVEASARCIPIYHYDGPITLTITRDGKDPNRWSWHI